MGQLADFVLEEEETGRVGRPAKVWTLTRAGHDRFPDTHADMTVRLIASTRAALGESALEAILAHRYQENLVAYAKALSGKKTLPTRLKKLAEMRTAEGYMAHVERQGGGWLLVESHCPICAAAAECQGFCSNELELFRTVLGDDVAVERVEYVLDNGSRCAYQIDRC